MSRLPETGYRRTMKVLLMTAMLAPQGTCIPAPVATNAPATQTSESADYYDLDIWRKGDNLYGVMGTGTSVYIVTQDCPHLAIGDKARLQWHGRGPYAGSRLYFQGWQGRIQEYCTVVDLIK